MKKLFEIIDKVDMAKEDFDNAKKTFFLKEYYKEINEDINKINLLSIEIENSFNSLVLNLNNIKNDINSLNNEELKEFRNKMIFKMNDPKFSKLQNDKNYYFIFVNYINNINEEDSIKILEKNINNIIFN
jgi:hypothetical protein